MYRIIQFDKYFNVKYYIKIYTFWDIKIKIQFLQLFEDLSKY